MPFFFATRPFLVEPLFFETARFLVDPPWVAVDLSPAALSVRRRCWLSGLSGLSGPVGADARADGATSPGGVLPFLRPRVAVFWCVAATRGEDLPSMVVNGRLRDCWNGKSEAGSTLKLSTISQNARPLGVVLTANIDLAAEP